MAMRLPRVSAWAAVWLAAACAAGSGLIAPARAAPVDGGATWVVEPGVPGTDLPPIGRSLFDHLTAVTRNGVALHEVPYPFTALLDRIASEIERTDSNTPIKRVLIPLGRSLQRAAAAPQYFAFPRVVAAVDGEPTASSRFFLKDRIYLGYQQKANLIEVISYNEAAGRFEFQLVRNYAPAQSPEVVYANRTICTSCHQNAGPIFSRQQWDETSANPEVARRIQQSARDFHGVDLERGVDVPYAIDNATDRANRFEATQLVWRDGCAGNGAAARRCRAGLFAAVLKYRLSGRAGVDVASPEFSTGVAAPLIASARARWPSGLAMPNPDIPNRNPLSSNGTKKSPAEVEAAFDPLALRGPLEVWRVDDGALAPRLVADLAEFVSAVDVARLDAKLASSWSREAVLRTTLAARCVVRRTVGERSRERVDFDCGAAAHDSRADMRVQARLEVGGERAPAIAVTRLRLPDQPPMLDLSVINADATTRSSDHAVSGTPRRGALHARTTGGDGIERLTFRWNGSAGAVEASIVRDSVRLESALRALSSEAAADRFDGFDASPFRRARLVPALFAALGAPTREACCLIDAVLPPARIDAVAAAEIPSAAGADGSQIAALQGFYRYCGACHLTREASPPNFLAGDATTVRDKLSQCAMRIVVRLGIWQRPFDPHAKTPMPPEVALRRHAITADAWRSSSDLAAMSSYAARLVDTRTGRSPERADILALNYEELPSCLPAIADRRAASAR